MRREEGDRVEGLNVIQLLPITPGNEEPEETGPLDVEITPLHVAVAKALGYNDTDAPSLAGNDEVEIDVIWNDDGTNLICFTKSAFWYIVNNVDHDDRERKIMLRFLSWREKAELKPDKSFEAFVDSIHGDVKFSAYTGNSGNGMFDKDFGYTIFDLKDREYVYIQGDRLSDGAVFSPSEEFDHDMDEVALSCDNCGWCFYSDDSGDHWEETINSMQGIGSYFDKHYPDVVQTRLEDDANKLRVLFKARKRLERQIVALDDGGYHNTSIHARYARTNRKILRQGAFKNMADKVSSLKVNDCIEKGKDDGPACRFCKGPVP